MTQPRRDRAQGAADAHEAQAAAAHACRPGCGACCIAPSISTPIPGMPDGKPSGVRCVQLRDDLSCAIFGHPDRPACCAGLRFSTQMCGTHREYALAYLDRLEVLTRAGR